MKLLLAEDTRDMNRAITAILSHEKYSVDSVYDGQEALDLLQREAYDMAILDIMMPKRSGLEVLKEIRRQNITTPVLLLTAKAEIDDRVEGLDAGADDYLTKPFAMKELLARIRSMTRRHTRYSADELHFANVTLRTDDLELASENSVRLSMKECELMQTLMLNAGKELHTDYLLTHVWNSEPGATADTVWLYVSYLKGKLKAINSRATINGRRGGSFGLSEL